MAWQCRGQSGMVSDVYLSKEKYFNNKQYLLGDLAFSASSVIVPAFKRGHNANLSKDCK